MEGKSRGSDKTTAYVRAEREANRVFGLEKPHEWSACKLLIDFLDDLFCKDKSATAKLAKPVRDYTISLPATITYMYSTNILEQMFRTSLAFDRGSSSCIWSAQPCLSL